MLMFSLFRWVPVLSLFLTLRNSLVSSSFREALVWKQDGGKWGPVTLSFAFIVELVFDSFIYFFHWSFRKNHLFLLGETRRDQCPTAVILILWDCSIVTGSKPDFLGSHHFSTFQPQAHHLQPLLLHLAAIWHVWSAALHFSSSISVWCFSHCGLVGSAEVHHHAPGPHGPGEAGDRGVGSLHKQAHNRDFVLRLSSAVGPSGVYIPALG